MENWGLKVKAEKCAQYKQDDYEKLTAVMKEWKITKGLNVKAEKSIHNIFKDACDSSLHQTKIDDHEKLTVIHERTIDSW